MKNVIFLIAVIVFNSTRLFSQNTSADMSAPHVMLNLNDMKWMDAPPGLPAGAKVSLLSGDPSKAGPFTLRAMFPANYKVPPHTHPTFENVVVLEGTLNMGSSETFDESKTTALNAGGYSSIPPNHPHFVFTKDKTVVQINGEGPFVINYINPADDPRNKK
ncbi:MAG TPA: cupin domain-containing protein [Flavitalea sp.]|nr:cupin domain-containing protein [Flavitalea sp.]